MIAAYGSFTLSMTIIGVHLIEATVSVSGTMNYF